MPARAEPDLPLIAPYVAHLHVKDSGGQPGTCDFPDARPGCDRLRQPLPDAAVGRFAGPYSVELEQPGRTLADQDDDMREAYRFVAATLAAVAAG